MSHPTRAQTLEQLRHGTDTFDVVVIGGGITGAGIAREAAGSGLKTLLVEQKDFAWGTSSRSSKMVHGGLRYLGSGQFGLARDAVRERQRLMAEAPGLITPLRFIMPHFRRQFPGPRLFQLLLWVYDRIAGQRSRQRLTPGQTLQWVPGLATANLVGASGFTDAVTDDTRLVLRVIAEARAAGALCMNYLRAVDIDRTGGRMAGVTLVENNGARDSEAFFVEAPLVINATGAWADRLRRRNGDNTRIRPLRGSHLILPFNTLPVSCSVSLLHPRDKRPVFAFPWQGTTVLGTTDLDHNGELSREPAITEDEVNYLLEIATTLFPGKPIQRSDIIATWAGVRPVVTHGEGKAPSRENREHVIWDDDGLISVAGGKLTTFRRIAREVLQRGKTYLPAFKLRAGHYPVFSTHSPGPVPAALGHLTWERLHGYYGPVLPEVLAAGPLEPVPGTGTLWAEVTWAVAREDVVHLDDLMLRRTRLGLILPEGGRALLDQVRMHCQEALDWDDSTWNLEVARYLDIWHQAYSLPEAQAGDKP